MSHIKVCIPSRNRAGRVTTLSLVSHFDEAFLFVNMDELKMYQEAYRNDSKVKVVGCNSNNITSTRNIALDHFPSGTRILFLDDDIKTVQYFNGKEILPITPENMPAFCDYAFGVCETERAKMFGLQPCSNPFFLKESFKAGRVINNFGFICATFAGVINTELRFDEKVKLKEDYDYTIQHILKFGKVVRFELFRAILSFGRSPEDERGLSRLPDNPDGR